MASDYEILIREHHLDTFGHVNNAVYLELFEEARWELISQRGYDIEYIKKSGRGPVILEINIRYKKELSLRQTVRITTTVLSYEGKVGRLRQQILNCDQEICCIADMTFGLFDTQERKLVKPTPEWLHALDYRLL